MANRGIAIAKPKPNGSRPIELASKWQEIGAPGLSHWSGYIQAAYQAELYWPACYPLLNRIRRSDTEIGGIVRTGYSALARKVEVEVVSPEKPNGDDNKAADFFESELTNVEGGMTKFIDTTVSYVPFMGWGWWEAAPGLRRVDWRPPNDLDGEPDPWRSEMDDGLVGIRRLAWRDHSAFARWDMGDRSGRLHGLYQIDPMNPVETLIPLDQSLHVTFGDSNNPEGLTPLESVWRLERIKYALEIIQGIGYEHSAGHAKFTSTKTLTDADKTNIRNAARAILTAQEGNYLALPEHITAEIMDVPFSAAPALLEAIRYYGLLKLQVYNMIWVAIASTAGTGAYSAMSDGSSMFLLYWNAMIDSFIDQYDEQIGKRLWAWNKDRFPQAQDRPRYKAKAMSKIIDLAELAAFMTAMKDTMPLGDDDFIEVRKRSGFLPEDLPEVVETPAPVMPAQDTTESAAEDQMEETPTTTNDEGQGQNMDSEQMARFRNTKAMFELAQELRRYNDENKGTT